MRSIRNCNNCGNKIFYTITRDGEKYCPKCDEKVEVIKESDYLTVGVAGRKENKRG